MAAVRSADGTAIVYDQSGHGPALDSRRRRHEHPLQRVQASAAQTPRRTLHGTQLRPSRPRGQRRHQPYTVGREIEDIEALIDQACASAYLYGHSSGGCLALDAAAQLGAKVSKLAMYEAPYNDDPAFRQVWAHYLEQLTAALTENRHGDAIALFMELVGIPAEQIEGMRRAPFWPGMEAVAPTLAYDHAGVIGQDPSVPVKRAAQVDVPALVLYGNRRRALHDPDRPDPEPHPPARRAPGPGRPEPQRRPGCARPRPHRVPVMTILDERLDATFAALADPTRRAILARLATGDATVNELAEPFDMTLPGISKHLKVLEQCGLISRTRRAQFRPCHLERERLDAAADWIETNRRIWAQRFDKLEAHLRDIQDAGHG